MLTGIRFRPFPEQKMGLFIAASLGTKTVVESRTAAAVVKHDPIKKRGVAKCDTLLLIFERKFRCLRYGQICPKLPLFQLGQKSPGSANGQKCLIALLFALCSKKSVTGD